MLILGSNTYSIHHKGFLASLPRRDMDWGGSRWRPSIRTVRSARLQVLSAIFRKDAQPRYVEQRMWHCSVDVYGLSDPADRTI